jgi:antitoxin HigA-1
MPRPRIHPGEHLRVDIEELGMLQTALARALHVPKNRISQIFNSERGISAVSALRVACWMGTTPQYWLNLSANYELRKVKQEAGEAIRDVITPLSHHAV